jgi:diaminopimelate decarboxylase
VESREELQVISSIAEQMQVQAPIAVRINPDIDIEGHPYLTTGKSANKFGISWQRQGRLSLGRHAQVAAPGRRALSYRLHD